MDDVTWKVLVAALVDAKFDREAAVTASLGKHVASLYPTGHVWVGRPSVAAVQAAGRTLPSWRANKLGRVYDLAWSRSGTSQPEAALQVKRKTTTPVSSKVLLFLSDILWGAIDSGTSNIEYSALYYEPGSFTDLYWPRFLTCSPSAKLIIDPSGVPMTTGNTSAWIDGRAKTIRPASQRQLNQVFSGGTNGKFVGLWHRPGRLEIDLTIRFDVGSSMTVLLASVAGVTLQGSTLPLEEWLP